MLNAASWLHWKDRANEFRHATTFQSHASFHPRSNKRKEQREISFLLWSLATWFTVALNAPTARIEEPKNRRSEAWGVRPPPRAAPVHRPPAGVGGRPCRLSGWRTGASRLPSAFLRFFESSDLRRSRQLVPRDSGCRRGGLTNTLMPLRSVRIPAPACEPSSLVPLAPAWCGRDPRVPR
jgi:hypothetical protein